MGISFHKSKNIAPGVRLNFSKSGISTSFGVKGARLNFGSKGVRTTFGIPGTGIRFRSYSKYGKGTTGSTPAVNQWKDPAQWGCGALLLLWFFAFGLSVTHFSVTPLLYAFFITVGVKMTIALIKRVKNAKEQRRLQRILRHSQTVLPQKTEKAKLDEQIALILADVPQIVRIGYNKVHSDFIKMVAYLSTQQYCSISVLQRRFALGFNAVSKNLNYLQIIGAVSEVRDPKGFKVLITPPDVPVLLNSVDPEWLIANSHSDKDFALSTLDRWVKMSVADLQKYPIGQLDNEKLRNDIEDAIFDGRTYIEIKREVYNEIIKLKPYAPILPHGDRAIQE